VGKKPIDPVTQYATDVCRGTIVAARLVRMACQRHLNDLQQAHAKGWRWDAEQAQRVIDFFADELILPENTDADDDPVIDVRGELEPRPFILTPFQQFIAGSLFGWYASRKTKAGAVRWVRRFRVAYVETAKGSGKTPFGAGLMLYLMVADGVRGAQVFSAAVTLRQAQDYGFTDARRMVEASPGLSARVDVKVNNLAVLETGSFFRPISSEKKGLDGKRVHGVLIDEEHEHRHDQVYLKMRAGTKGRPSALVFITTNSGFDLESVCWRHHDYSRQVLDGTLVNDTWFAFICHLDACDRCYAAGKLQPSDDCPDCDDWKTEGPHWLKPNPNLGVTIQWDYLREQVQEAIGIPSQRNMVRRLNFCQWTQQATVWIPQETWAACASSLHRGHLALSLHGNACYLGIDLSDKIDLSSVQAIFPRPMSADVELPQMGGEPVTIDRAIDVLSYFWMPKASLVRRSQEDKIPYVEWEQDGWLTATTGAMVDHDAIVDFIIAELAAKFQIKGIGIDQSGASAVITRLRRHFGEEFVVEVPQGFRRLNTPSRMIEALIMSRNLVHDGNPLMQMCITNTAVEENSWREIRPVKISQRKRIDGAVALIDAEAVLLEKPPEPESVYLTRGVRVLGA
jgi:phage terminase large subunit-like protein